MAAFSLVILCAVAGFASAINQPTDVTAVSLSPQEVVIGWQWNHDSETVTFMIELDGGNTNQTVNCTGVLMWEFGQLEKNSSYSLNIKSIVGDDVSEPVVFSFKTMENDWPAPVITSDVVIGESPSGKLLYNVSWEFSADNVSYSFNATTCSEFSCDHNFAGQGSRSLKHEVPYYSDYNLTLSVIYELPLFLEQRRYSPALTARSPTGKPWVVRNLTVSQHPYSTNFSAQWEPPAQLNGNISYYLINVTDGSKTELLSMQVHQAESVVLKVPYAESYYFLVSAVSIDDKTNETFQGDSIERFLALQKPDALKKVDVYVRSDKALELNVALETEQSFCRLEYDGQVDDFTPICNIMIESLKVYELVNFNMSICFMADETHAVCGEKYEGSARSNVGIPSKVENLKATLVDNKPQLKWEQPTTSNGPIDGYDIFYNASTIELIARTNGTTVLLNEAQTCTKYEATVIAYNTDLITGEPVFGEPNEVVIETRCSSAKLTTWLVVIGVLASVGAAGGFVYYKKKQECSQIFAFFTRRN